MTRFGKPYIAYYEWSAVTQLLSFTQFLKYYNSGNFKVYMTTRDLEKSVIFDKTVEIIAVKNVFCFIILMKICFVFVLLDVLFFQHTVYMYVESL